MSRKTIKNLEKIQDHYKQDKPLWVLLSAQIVQQLPIGLIDNLAISNLLELPNKDDMINWDKFKSNNKLKE